MDQELRRCFIALELPREAINRIKEVQDLIKKKKYFYGKFTEPENLHLTLKFLGEIDDEKIEEVKRRLKKIMIKEFEARLGEIGFFSQKFLKIIWVKLEGKSVFELQKLVDENLEGLFDKEVRFMSHITIARVKKVLRKKDLIDYIKNIKIKDLRFRVKEFILKESELTKEGPIYADVEKYSLES